MKILRNNNIIFLHKIKLCNKNGITLKYLRHKMYESYKAIILFLGIKHKHQY